MLNFFIVVICCFFSIETAVYGAAYDLNDLRRMPVNIIIPAYNEENRIGQMLKSYCTYFEHWNVHFTVVLNGIIDNTKAVVENVQKDFLNKISIVESEKGKGSAIKTGFLQALNQNCECYELIGFVDADGSIAPDQYDKLLTALVSGSDYYDGIIASRYMEGSDLGAPRSFIKEYGRKWFYNRRIEKALDLHYNDYQCGAKVFKRKVIEVIAPLITETGWAIDLDILYLSRKHEFSIAEVPIRWRDAPGSHLSIFSSGKDLYEAVNRISKK